MISSIIIIDDIIYDLQLSYGTTCFKFYLDESLFVEFRANFAVLKACLTIQSSTRAEFRPWSGRNF